MRTAIGIDLGGTNMRAALVTEDGQILASAREKTGAHRGPEAVAEDMGKMVTALLHMRSEYKVEGIGIGSPGPLSRKNKVILGAVNLPGFVNFPLGERVEKHTGLRVELDNDAKCATYGEGMFGAARGLHHYLLMTFGTGIGGGIVVNGQMIYGKTDNACEVGHVTLYPDGELCNCGNRGCFERYASASAIERRSTEGFGRALNAREIFRLLDQGDARAETLLRAVARDIAIATASFVNLFDPEAIIFGGGIFSEGGGPMPQWIREEIRDRCFKSSQQNLRVVASALAGNAGVLGAASLIFRS